MKIGTRCTVCRVRIDETELQTCERCGRGLHEPCEEYVTTFECASCGDEPWIDAVEF